MPLDSQMSATALEVALELTKLACPNQSLVTDLELRSEPFEKPLGDFSDIYWTTLAQMIGPQHYFNSFGKRPPG
jgi:hypothetical protein